MATILHKRLTISQLGLVVRNLERAMDGYLQLVGPNQWSIYINSAPPLKCTYRGHPSNYKVRVAMAKAGQLQLELIEYIEGETIHRDFLASGREGLEHIGVIVPNLDLALAHYKAKGIDILQQVDGLGIAGDGRYAYLDTESILGTVLELIQNPSQPRPPEQIYPSKANN